MPKNLSQLIRISTIDEKLQNGKKRTLDELIDACTEAVDCPNRLSRRTIQNDIALMRNGTFGYEAPIVVCDNKYYKYSDPEFTITRLPLSDEGVAAIQSAIDILRQLQYIPEMKSSIDIISKLNEQISRKVSDAPRALDMERVDGYRGEEHIRRIYEAVRNRQVIIIAYKSFKAREAEELIVHPYLLKEYRNRWFLIAQKAGSKTPQIVIFALDRIKSVKTYTHINFLPCPEFDPEHFFDDTIGVTRMIGDKARRVVLKVDRDQAPYVETKPFHKSQKVEEYHGDGGIKISLKVVINNELVRLILGFGNHIEVIAPPELRQRVGVMMKRAAAKYDDLDDC